MSFVSAQEAKLLAAGMHLAACKHCVVAFEKPHSERSSSKYLNSQWWRVFHLNPGIYRKHTHTRTHSHTLLSAMTPFTPHFGCWVPRCFGMRFIATQDCCWHGESPAKERERRGGEDHCGLPSCSLLKPK